MSQTDTKVAEYRGTVLYCAATAAVLTEFNIPQLLRDIDHAHAIGPILDPTLYREKMAKMEEDKELLQAALKLREIGLKIKKRLEEKHT